MCSFVVPGSPVGACAGSRSRRLSSTSRRFKTEAASLSGRSRIARISISLKAGIAIDADLPQPPAIALAVPAVVALAFKIDTDGGGFQVLRSFGSGDGGGEKPYGSLRLSRSDLYGATSSEKTDHGGTVFRIGTDRGGFQVLHRFSDSEGMWPYESPILSGTTLYGVTTYGGSARGWDGGGTLYRVSADGTDFRVLHTFARGSDDGKAPHGALLQSGPVLYSLTFRGGASNLGTLFRIDTDGTDYRVLHHFAGGNSDGASPRGGALIQSGSTIYGMARQGGPADGGAIFSIGADGSNYRVLHFFEGGPNDGLKPFSASLTQSGPLLYGMTSAGGANGIVFRIKTDGTEFQVLHRFSGSDGAKPVGSLILSGTTLFGMTMTGGYQGNGVIFALDVAPQPEVKE